MQAVTCNARLDGGRLTAMALIVALLAGPAAAPLLAAPDCGTEDTDADGVADGCDNCSLIPNPGTSLETAEVLSALATGYTGITSLVPTRFDFSDGDLGLSIADGGGDMYDGGNFLNTNLESAIPYTTGTVVAPAAAFGVGSSYFTAKYPGLFVLVASHMTISTFTLTGNNGADDIGTADGAVLATTANGAPFTIFVKRVFGAGDPSINHIVIVPAGGGVTHTFPLATDDDRHVVSGLLGTSALAYLLVARQSGARLDDSDVLAIAQAFLGMLSQADADGDGAGDACDTDDDDDTILDAADNCRIIANPGQEDDDGDNVGNACDNDSDNDGVPDGADPCPFEPDPANSCANLFACSGTGGSASSLYRINPDNGIAVQIGVMGLRTCGGLALHPDTGALFAVGRHLSSGQGFLWSVDPTTGAATPIGSGGLDFMADLAFRADGTLFGLEPTFARLWNIDTSTGVPTLIGSGTRFGGGNGITFSPSAQLLNASGDQLCTIDQGSGSATQIAALEFPAMPCSAPRITAMDRHRNGTIYAIVNCSPEDMFVATLDPSTGVVTAIAPTVGRLEGIAFAGDVCGDGLLSGDEVCDDGNTIDGDCCSSTCEPAPAGLACAADAMPCTADVCDGLGHCSHPIIPQTGCRTAQRSTVMWKQNGGGDDKLLWTWANGQSTSGADFGAVTSTTYDLCIYDGSVAGLVADLTVPPSTLNWRAVAHGYAYLDPTATAAGVETIVLKTSGDNRSRIVVRGRGAALPDPGLMSLAAPLTVQLRRDDSTLCWESRFDAADVVRQRTDKLKARRVD